MEGSILKSTKKILGLSDDDTSFDLDVITHINSAFLTLNQLGVGPDEGFAIQDATSTWDQFLGSDIRLNAARTYVYLKVRLVFDPPTTSFLLAAMQKQVEEIEWRLNTHRELLTTPPVIVDESEGISSDDLDNDDWLNYYNQIKNGG